MEQTDRVNTTIDSAIQEATIARIVLEDCRSALHELRQNPTGPRWRIQWVAMLALLRVPCLH